MEDKNTINVLYIVWGESIAYNGLFDNQVVEQIIKIKKETHSIKLTLLTGIPLTKRFLRDKKKYLREIEKVKKYLQENQIEMIVKWVITFSKYFYSNLFMLPFFHIGYLLFLRRLILKDQYHILHCRSYHSTLIAHLVKKLFRLSYKIIFDTRGLFPEEAVVAGCFSAKSISYKLWKFIEKKLLDNSDAIVNVSETFTEHVLKITDNPCIVTIPTSTNTQIFSGRNLEKRNIIRKKLGLDANEKILVYLGALDELGWHSVENFVKIYSIFKALFTNTKLLLITRLSKDILTKRLTELNILENEILIVETNSPQETVDYLQISDYGTLPLKKINNDLQAIIGRTMVSSKAAEYLASGLPIIVNKDIGETSNLVRDNDIGCIFTLGEEDKIKDCLKHIEKNYEKVSQSCIKFAREYFDTTVHAKQYIELYQKLYNI